MNLEPTAPPSFSPARRFGIGLNVAVSVVAVVALVVMVNYLASRHFRRFQWTGDTRFMLSVQTKMVLQALTNEVRITVLFDREHKAYTAVAGLLKEYAYACPRLRVEHVDYKRDLGRAEFVIAKYQLPKAAADVVIFDANSRTRVVRASELFDYGMQDWLRGQAELRQVAFRGEPLFTGALAGLLDARPPVAYFLQGHGEHDPTSDEALFGYAKFATLLHQKNIVSAPLRLGGDQPIPTDCQLLIIAGPQARFEATELDRIRKYLDGGGRLLALLSYYRSRNAATGLERLLADYGLTLGEDYTFDPRNTRTGNDLVCTNFSGHPVVKPLADTGLYLVWARSVYPKGGGAGAPRVQTLVSTGEEGYTASEMTAGGAPRPNPLRDRRGVIPLALAVEKGSIEGVGPDSGSSRMVVVGESVFLGNETIGKAANLDFAGLAVNWLLDRPQLLAGLVARPMNEYRILLTHSEMIRMRWLLLGALPGTAWLVGVLVWVRRRS